ncbi:hypothetical protein D3C87_1599480 [compost metagenome]
MGSDLYSTCCRRVHFRPILLKNSMFARHRSEVEKLASQIVPGSTISSWAGGEHPQKHGRVSSVGVFQQNRPEADTWQLSQSDRPQRVESNVVSGELR